MEKLETIQQWQALKQRSNTHPIIIFKHSNNSDDSTAAQGHLARAERMEAITEPIHILIVDEAPELSDAIAQELQVQHASPQVIIMRDDKAIYHADEDAIDADVIEQQL